MGELTVEMLPEVYKELARVVGVNGLLSLTKEFGGIRLYIPKRDKLIRTIRDSNIRNEYPNMTYKELAIRYNLSESRVREILNDKEVDGQLNIFDISL